MKYLNWILVVLVVMAGGCATPSTRLTDCNWRDTFLPKSPPPARHIYAVPVRGLSADERIALTCLQGLLARKEPRIWLIHSENDQFWINRYQTRGDIASYEIVTNWPTLFRNCSVGTIVPDPVLYRGDLLAVMVAACEDAIVAPPELAQRLGLPVKMDLRGRFTSYADGLRWVWNTYQSKLNHQFCEFRLPSWLPTCSFDYSYEFRAPIFWIAGKKDGAKPGADPLAENKIVSEILAAMKPDSVCVGFPCGGSGTGIGEPAGVELLSRYGHSLVCNNLEANCSMLSGVHIARFEQPKQPPPPPLQHDKIYIALALSDGDNQILWPDYYRRRYFEHPSFGKFPLAFGMGPAIRELQPVVAQWYFEHATPTTEFMADVSGAGYMNPDHFAEERSDREKIWSDYLGWTARLMQTTGMKTIRTVGGKDDTVARFAAALPFCHSIFADMGRYYGHSGITNLTYSLPDGMPVFRAVTSWRYGKDGFLREVREQVGAQRPAFVNGFVHCWTFSMDDLTRIYEQRDADMVFVTPSQLAQLYRQFKQTP